jgi:hypothetical protein
MRFLGAESCGRLSETATRDDQIAGVVLLTPPRPGSATINLRRRCRTAVRQNRR